MRWRGGINREGKADVERAPSPRPPFPADTGADAVPTASATRWTCHARPPRPRVPGARQAVLAGIKRIFKTDAAVVIYPLLRDWRLGGGARQHAVARRSRADGRDRPVRDAVEARWRAPGPRGRLPRRRLAPRRRCGAIEERLRDDAHAIKAVCVVHNETSTGSAPHPEVRAAIDARGAPGAADGRYDLVARLDRLPPRRVGRRRHRVRLAEGPDAAAGPVVHRGQREGARGSQDGASCRALTGLGRTCCQQCDRLLPLHAGHQSALRPRRGDRHAERGRPRQRVRASRAPRRGDPSRGSRLGPRDPVPRAASTIRRP